MDRLPSLGRTLATLRSIRGLSVEQCAGAIHIAPGELRDAEMGHVSPEVLDALARFHALDGEALLDAQIESLGQGTVFLLHGSCQDFSSTDLVPLERAMQAGRMLSALSGALDPDPPLKRRLDFFETPPAGPRPRDAALQGYRLARRVRTSVDVPEEPLRDARQLLEETFGVAVNVAELSSRGLQAASIVDRRGAAAAVVLGANDERREQNPEIARVHLAHELCHLLFDPAAPGLVRIALDEWDIDRPSRRRSATTNDLLESRAKGFAAEMLLPDRGLRSVLGVPRQVGSLVKACGLVDEARSHFGTPWEIATYHLRNLGFLADEVVTDVLNNPVRATHRIPTHLPEANSLPVYLDSLLKRDRATAAEFGVTRAALEAWSPSGALPRFVAAAQGTFDTVIERRGRDVLAQVMTEVAADRRLEATDLLVDHLDVLFRRGEFDAARCWVVTLDPTALPPETIGGALMVTAHARTELGKVRCDFVDRALAALRARWGLPDDAITRIRGQFA